MTHKLIVLDNKYARFMTSDAQLLKQLRNHLSYKQAGAEYSAAYQNGWNGQIYLMHKTGAFPSGLVPRVREYLRSRGIPFEEEDKRPTLVPAIPIDLTPKLSKLGMLPRDHQKRIVAACLQHDKGIVRAATGSGKSLATALLTAQLNKPTVIYVIGLDLLHQFHQLFSKLFNERIGYVGNGECRIERITIATIWTIASALRVDRKHILAEDEESDEEKFNESQREKILQMLKSAKVHILDESHVAATNTISSIHEVINPEHIYGFSGTPFRDDNSDLLINGILGEQIINVNASELIAANLLAQPIIKFVPVPKLIMHGNPTYLSVYRDYVVENSVRNNLIVENTRQLLEKGYTPLVLFKQIKHGKLLLEMMEEVGIQVAMLCGNDDLERRNEVKDMLVKKKIQVILASTIFDIGMDLPQLNALVLAGGGKSTLRANQRIGRVIRPMPGKKYAAVVEFFDQCKFLKKHSLIRHDVYAAEQGFKVIKCAAMDK